ncbi:hypothetical protein [Sulfurisphaera ohwakuensis]|uniref:Uncharacterized protein n=1 Tax=Sulfurisphaera ohwakuensis TaxID=69656 RepID=A0A650CFS3_SULOH|nr:hypothetical protein [Sulfurisphaera ohwakuensis]MBB5254134.1 hypothetical protein [Sulfurisphaera ohwakuensis]QGR16515.1 hypothetical protein D1869_04355 [Sulfurisphaera ohwakuensis]
MCNDFPINAKRIAKLYELTSDYFSQINKTYAQLLQIRKETAIIVQLKEVYRQLLDITRKCFQSEAKDDICKNLPKEIKIILSIYNNKPYLIDQILSMYDLGIQEMVDIMLYTAYLARTAVIADYSVGREEKDEKYLEEIRDHQKETIEFMRKIAQINKNLVKSTELDDYIDEIEDSNRSMYEQK